MTRSAWMVLLLTSLLMARPAVGQTLSGEALVKALRQGGYVLVMRHTSSPREAPTTASANPDNVKLERQLDETGRTTATAMGNAFRRLKIPIGSILSSPTYRALETARLAQFSNPRIQAELGDGGQSMSGVTKAQSAWLQQQVLVVPPRGTNTLLVTHLPNMAAAFPQETSGLSDGETLVFHADGAGGRALVARIKVEQWAATQP
jgi:phosphohistidine phosphatase SixA